MANELADAQEATRGELGLGTELQHNKISALQRAPSRDTHTFKSSGSASSPGFFVGYGSRTKLSFTTCSVGVLFASKYSSSHIGIVSSKVCTSVAVLATVPRYVVRQLGGASSEMISDVSGGSANEGASADDGGVSGFRRMVCNANCVPLGPGVVMFYTK